MKKAWHYFWDDGPMVFVYCVIAYFAITLMNVGEKVPTFTDISSSAQEIIEEPSGTTAAPVATSGLDVAVKSLRVRPDDGRLVVNVTLEIDNPSKSNVAFRPDGLVLTSADGAQVRAETGPSVAVTVAPHVAQLIPLSFSLPPSAMGPYALEYNGHVLFSGYSV